MKYGLAIKMNNGDVFYSHREKRTDSLEDATRVFLVLKDVVGKVSYFEVEDEYQRRTILNGKKISSITLQEFEEE